MKKGHKMNTKISQTSKIKYIKS